MKNNPTKDLLIRRIVSREVFMKYMYQKALMGEEWVDIYEDLNNFLDLIEEDAMEIYNANEGKELDILETYRDSLFDSAYLMDMSSAIEEHIVEIDEYINKYARNWSIDTLPAVDVAILRVAVAEIKYSFIVPNGVACDQAVNLAKKYCDDNAYKYINGILGSVVGK